MTKARGEVRIVEVDPADPRASAAVEVYLGEVAGVLEGGFVPGPEDLAPFRAPSGAFRLALDAEDTVVGCVGVRTIGPGTCEIKRMWIDPRARGIGLGRRLLQGAEDTAARLGASLVRLDTNASLRTAVALYRSAGYAEIEPYNDNPHAEHWFEKRL